jgi:hypothetical protein
MRYANQLPGQMEGLIVQLKSEKPHWGARKIRELLVRRLDELLRPATPQHQTRRPIRAETRAALVASIARGRQWLDELLTNPATTIDLIAAREHCTPRKINMTISLAFLAPDLVKAALDGRLPDGMGIARLADMPAEWQRQYQALGLATP